MQEEIEYLDEDELGFDPNAEDMEDWSDEEYGGSGECPANECFGDRGVRDSCRLSGQGVQRQR